METNEMMKSFSEKQVAGNGFFADDALIQVNVEQCVQYEEQIEKGFVY